MPEPDRPWRRQESSTIFFRSLAQPRQSVPRAGCNIKACSDLRERRALLRREVCNQSGASLIGPGCTALFRRVCFHYSCRLSPARPSNGRQSSSDRGDLLQKPNGLTDQQVTAGLAAIFSGVCRKYLQVEIRPMTCSPLPYVCSKSCACSLSLPDVGRGKLCLRTEQSPHIREIIERPPYEMTKG